MVLFACAVSLMPEHAPGAASGSGLANTIKFSPGTVWLDNPVTVNRQGKPTRFSLALSVYDENGALVNPRFRHIEIHLYGAPKGVITPNSALVTRGGGVMFYYNGGYLPNPVTVEAYMKLKGQSAGYAIGVTQLLPKNPVQGFGTQSYNFPYWCDNQTQPNCQESIIRSPLQFMAAVGYSNPTEDQFEPFGLDTGSLGVIVPLNSLGPDAIGPGSTGIKFYNSSGNTYEGHYYLAPVVISATRDGSSALVRTFPIKVLAIDKAYCAPGYPKCDEDPPTPDLLYIGVGFDRNSTTPGDSFDSPADNAFLQIAAEGDGTDVNPGYVLTTAGGRIGITEADAQGFHVAQLTANTSVPGDWKAAPGCFGFPNAATKPHQFCGSLLMDVGISEMFIDLKPDLRPPSVVEPDVNGTEVPSGTAMSVLAGIPSQPAMQYRFTYNPSTNPPGMAPTTVTWINPKSSEVFVNTGRNVLKGFNYLFDARHGRVGFKPLVSYFVPVVRTQFGTEPDKYHVYVSNGGGQAHPMVVDTGSQLMVVPVQYVGPQAQAVTPTLCHSIGYGDNTTWCGRFYSGPVAIGVPEDYTPGDGSYPTTQASFSFLVADQNDTHCIEQLNDQLKAQGKKGCKMPPDLTNRGIMGIGFGQGSCGPDYNALLQLEEVARGEMEPGYIIHLGRATPGFTVGLTPDNMRGFRFIPLSASKLYPGQWDPNSFDGCVSFSATDNSTVFNKCANVLFDTGTVNFTLMTPSVGKKLKTIMTKPPDIDPGITVSVKAPSTAPIISYTYSTTSNTSWETCQSSVSWEQRNEGVFFLIGQYVFLRYDYLFDPTAGLIGFKPLKAQ
jgi:hypothetical protein